jgi:hypothetical protein
MTPAEARQKMLSEGYAPEEVDKALASVAPSAAPPTPDDHTPEKPESVARGLKQGLTLGWGDEGSAAIAATLPFLDPEAAKGKNWGERYEAAKALYRHLDRAARKENPLSFATGDIAGSMAPTAKIFGAAKGGALVARGALSGAVSGAGGSDESGGPGASIGDVVVGAVLGALGTLPIAALDKLPALKSWLADRARIEAFKQAAAGNAKSELGKLATRSGQGRAQQVGQYLLDKGILSQSDKPADIAGAAGGLVRSAGKEIGDIAGPRAVQAGATVNLPSLIKRIETEVTPSFSKGGSLMSPATGKLQDFVGDLKTLQANLGDDVPAAVVHELRQTLDKAVRGYQGDKAVGSALTSNALDQARKVVNAELNRSIKGAGLGEAWKGANREFGLAKDLERVAKKGAEAVGNRELGMSEQLAMTGAPGVVGAVLGAVTGGPAGAGIGGAAGAATGAIASNLWRKHGSGIAARGMSNLSELIPRLQASPQMTPYADFLRQAFATAGPAGAASAHFLLFDKDPTYRQGVTTAEKAEGQ